MFALAALGSAQAQRKAGAVSDTAKLYPAHTPHAMNATNAPHAINAIVSLFPLVSLARARHERMKLVILTGAPTPAR